MMTAEVPPAPVRISQAFAKLRDSAKTLNKASNALSQPVAALEANLATLKVHVACWTEISKWTEDGYHYYYEYVGYTEVKGAWCIAIQTCDSADDDPFDRNVKVMAFNDAPFYLRAKAIDKLPDLLEALIATVDATAERVQKKIQPAKELADAIGALVKK